jgi:hypothetical protein
VGQHAAAQQKPTTFELTVFLPVPTMHVAEDLWVKVSTSNSTDHVVHAGNGYLSANESSRMGVGPSQVFEQHREQLFLSLFLTGYWVPGG